MSVLRHLRILPVMVMVASLALLVRVGEFAAGLEQGGYAFAQQEVSDQPPPMPGKELIAREDSGEEATMEKPDTADVAADDVAGASVAPPDLGAAGEKVEWKDASESEFDYSEVREGLYKDLTARREELERRERALATREALLEAAERELEQKIREMTAVRNEIEGMMVQQSEEEKKRVGSLVKIYEGMKAKDAARIFDTLDMDVLISVLSLMSERKSAPILAEMSPERARSVTILLAQQKQIPEIPPQ